MRILVTGADGMLGTNTVRELLKRGHQVRAFLLPNSPAKTLAGLDIEKTFGNILKEEDLTTAAEGCDAIIHTAANTNIWPNRSEMVRRVNIDGTKNILTAAKKAQVKRLVYIGTANSFGFGSKADPGHEGNSYQSQKYGLDYMDSKYEAQLLVIKAAREEGLPALTINPTFMLGPYDSKPGAGAMVLAIYQKKVPGFAVGGRNYICVKDVATAIANALTMGRIGESYIAGNENMDYREAFTKIAKVVGVKPPKVTIPPVLSKAYGFLGTQYGTLFNKTPVVSLAMAQISCDDHYFTSQKAVEELKMPLTNVEEGIRDCFEWLKENEYC